LSSDKIHLKEEGLLDEGKICRQEATWRRRVEANMKFSSLERFPTRSRILQNDFNWLREGVNTVKCRKSLKLDLSSGRSRSGRDHGREEKE
jgi:hypothetical protein